MAQNAGVEVAVWQRGRVVATRLVPNASLSTAAATFAFALTDGELFSLEDVDTYPVTLTLAWGDDTLVVPGVEVDELVMNVLPLSTVTASSEPTGTGSALLGLLTTGSGAVTVAGTGTALVPLNVAGTGTVPTAGVVGSGGAALSLAVTATGTVVWPVRTGTGTAALTLLTSGSGTVASNTSTGTGTAALALLTSGSGTVTTTTRTGTGTAALALLTSATGTVTTITRTGTGAAAIALATTSTGTVLVSGSSGTLVLAVSASGTGLVNTTSILVPDTTVSQSNWTITGAASVHAALAVGDADFIQANVANATCRVGLSNPAVTFASLNAVSIRVRVQRP